MNVFKKFKGICLPRMTKSLSSPIELASPNKVWIPLRQHQGEICNSIVKPKDHVSLGQTIGISEKLESAFIHASVSGIVEKIDEVYDPIGKKIKAIVINNDKKDSIQEITGEHPSPLLKNREDVLNSKSSYILERLRKSGLVRSNLLGLPLHISLAKPRSSHSYMALTGAPLTQSIDTLIIRAVDLDPFILPNQTYFSADFSKKIELGISALIKITKAKRVVIAVSPNDIDETLKKMIEEREWETTIIDNRYYPSAHKNFIIHNITNRIIPTPYGRPQDVRVVFESLINVLDLAHVLTTGLPVTERIFYVAGDIDKPRVFRVRLGTPLSEIIKSIGKNPQEIGKIILGGPMLGYAHFDFNIPITKETEGMFIQDSKNLKKFKDEACIHCSRCVRVCPVNLIPAELSKLCEFKQFENAASLNLFNCIECGCCSYVCPSHRPMVQLMRYGKSEILAERTKE